MDFTDKLLSSFIAFEDMVNVNDPVHEIRTEALKRFEQQGFPTKKQEAWKYTSLQELLAIDYSIFPKDKLALEYASVRQYFLHEIETFKIVFVDGQYSSFLSETTHDGVDVCLFSSAIEKPKYKHIIEAYFNKVANAKDALTNLNTSFANEGAYIFIPKGKAPLKPIEIVHFATGNTPQILLQPRNLIVLEEGAEAQIIERHQALAPIEAFTNSVTEIYAEKNAILDYYKFQNDHQTASLIDNTYIDQKQGSEVRVHTLTFGNKLVRNNLNFYQNGEHCNSILKGVTLASERQHIDHFTLVHHVQPNCESHQDYKGIYDDRSVGVFNGKIVVDQIAQKINAFQQNNNLLVSDKSTVNTKPQLEIFADDVRCSHGCTIGQLDKEALFYLRSRGIPEKEARALLMYAFANNVLESVKNVALERRVKQVIADKLGVRLGFDL